jgi:hypothetical protein
MRRALDRVGLRRHKKNKKEVNSNTKQTEKNWTTIRNGLRFLPLIDKLEKKIIIITVINCLLERKVTSPL